jgi:hypothetical protein
MAKFVRLPQFRIFKGKGALQLELQPATMNEEGVVESGFAMLTLVPSVPDVKDSRGNPTYNWKDQKIVMKMNDKDLTDLFLALSTGEARKIVHDTNAGTGEAKEYKTLTVNPAQNSGMFLGMTFKDQKASVPLDDNEIMRLRMLIPAAVQSIYGWNHLYS